MNIFCVEWWDDLGTKYTQEYFKCPGRAGMRAQMLQQDVAESDPQISTIFVDIGMMDRE